MVRPVCFGEQSSVQCACVHKDPFSEFRCTNLRSVCLCTNLFVHRHALNGDLCNETHWTELCVPKHSEQSFAPKRIERHCSTCFGTQILIRCVSMHKKQCVSVHKAPFSAFRCTNIIVEWCVSVYVSVHKAQFNVFQVRSFVHRNTVTGANLTELALCTETHWTELGAPKRNERRFVHRITLSFVHQSTQRTELCLPKRTEQSFTETGPSH